MIKPPNIQGALYYATIDIYESLSKYNNIMILLTKHPKKKPNRIAYKTLLLFQMKIRKTLDFPYSKA